MKKKNAVHFSHNLKVGNGCTLGRGALLKFIKSHYRSDQKNKKHQNKILDSKPVGRVGDGGRVIHKTSSTQTL